MMVLSAEPDAAERTRRCGTNPTLRNEPDAAERTRRCGTNPTLRNEPDAAERTRRCGTNPTLRNEPDAAERTRRCGTNPTLRNEPDAAERTGRPAEPTLRNEPDCRWTLRMCTSDYPGGTISLFITSVPRASAGALLVVASPGRPILRDRQPRRANLEPRPDRGFRVRTPSCRCARRASPWRSPPRFGIALQPAARRAGPVYRSRSSSGSIREARTPAGPRSRKPNRLAYYGRYWRQAPGERCA